MTGDDGTPIGVPLVGFTTISDKTLEHQETPACHQVTVFELVLHGRDQGDVAIHILY